MANKRLSNLSTLAIEKSLLHELSNNQSFKDRIIDAFAERKKRRIDLIYKKKIKVSLKILRLPK